MVQTLLVLGIDKDMVKIVEKRNYETASEDIIKHEAIEWRMERRVCNRAEHEVTMGLQWANNLLNANHHDDVVIGISKS